MNMREIMRLVELADGSPYPITKVNAGRYEFTSAGGVDYVVYGTPMRDGLYIGFHGWKDGRPGYDTEHSLSVLRTVLVAVRTMLADREPATVTFDGTDRKRDKLYSTFIRNISKYIPGYTAHETKHASGAPLFILTANQENPQ